MKAWHFLKEDKKLRWDKYGIVEVGKELSVNPKKLVLCRYGLHASVKALDALRYAPGPIICRVELGGKILKDNDKVCAEKRKVIWMADATRTLHLFACWCATNALKKAKVTDKKCWDAIKAKKDWLDGLITDKKLKNANYAAGAAARDAAGAAAWAAWAAAWDAAWAAARAAAGAAAGDAERLKQNRKLTKMLNELKPFLVC